MVAEPPCNEDRRQSLDRQRRTRPAVGMRYRHLTPYGALTAICIAVASPAQAEPAQRAVNDPPPDPVLNEEIVRLPIAIKLHGAGTYKGEFVLTTFRPNGPGPFPAAIINHGRGDKPAEYGRSRMLAHFWTRRGFAVLAPTRLGYGVSGAALDPEGRNTGPCENKNFAPMVSAIAAHIRATADYAATLPWIDKDNLVLAGASVGGFGAVASPDGRLPGLKAIVNFAGGTGGRPQLPGGQSCGPRNVELHMVAAARKQPVPSIWFYVENDEYWGPTLPREWHAAYIKAGGMAELHVLPPIGENGHDVVRVGYQYWRPLLDRFLTSAGFEPRKPPADAPPPTGFASLTDVLTVPQISQRCREIYTEFLNSDIPRAFAVGPKGTCSYFGGQLDVVAKALARCKERAEAECKLYAVNDDVVW
jgi:dienelactone hydrolase